MRTVSTTLLLAGCLATPGLDEGKLDETGLVDTGTSALSERIVVSFSLALQRSDWGESLSRCQVEVAFLEEGQRDGLFSDSGIIVERPEVPGTCTYTNLEGEQAEGPWTIRGTRRGGEVIYLHGDAGSIELGLTTDSSGRYTYALDDCDQSTFPFAQVLDLEVPGWDGTDGIEGFAVEGALIVGPDVAFTSLPGTMTDTGRLLLPMGEDLAVRWQTLQALPEVDGEPATSSHYLMLRNMYPGVGEAFEALACLPEVEGEATISALDMATLTPCADLDAGDPYIAFQVDTWIEGPTFSTPWRSSSRALSVVTEGGTALLVP